MQKKPLKRCDLGSYLYCYVYCYLVFGFKVFQNASFLIVPFRNDERDERV